MKIDNQARISIHAELCRMAKLSPNTTTYICADFREKRVFLVQNKDALVGRKVLSVRKMDSKRRLIVSKEVLNFLKADNQSDLLCYVQDDIIFIQ